MSWSDVSVLITGAGGFIGSHLTEALLRQHARVRAFIRYTSDHDLGWLRQVPPEVANRLEICRGDVRDSSAVLDAVEGCDTVFHLAAVISIPYSYEHPREVVETNVLGTLNVLEAVRRHGVGRLVHTSSSEVYGTAQRVPMDETHPLHGQSPYAASKVGADQLVESYTRSFGVSAVTIRPFNTYGPRQSARAVIPTIILQLLHADTIRLGSLDPVRDFTFVQDTVEALLLAGQAEGVNGETINLGSNQAVSIQSLAEQIMSLAGRRVPIVSESRRKRPMASEVTRLQSDHSMAKQLLGWQPAISLEEGLRQTLDWFREHHQLYEPEVYYV